MGPAIFVWGQIGLSLVLVAREGGRCHSKEYPYQGSKAPKGASNSASFAESWPSTIRSGEPRALHVAESRLGPVSTHSLEAVSSAPPIQRVSPARSPYNSVAPAVRQSSPLATGDGPQAEATSRSRQSPLDAFAAQGKTKSGKKKQRQAANMRAAYMYETESSTPYMYRDDVRVDSRFGNVADGDYQETCARQASIDVLAAQGKSKSGKDTQWQAERVLINKNAVCMP